eukprot:5855458-Karenia_brevis.AAC.1
MLRTYTSRLLDLAGTGSQYSSRSVVFGTCDSTPDIDPYISILYRRLHIMRRMLANKPHLLDLIRDTYDAYAKLHFAGTHYDGLDVASLQPAPLSGAPNRHLWKSKVIPTGPV